MLEDFTSEARVPADFPFGDTEYPDSVSFQIEDETKEIDNVTQVARPEEPPAQTTQQVQSDNHNYTPINYYMTGYCTNGQGGWNSTGNSQPAKEFLLSDSKIIGDKESFTKTGQLTMFNIPVQVYVCDTNNKFFILSHGNELMYAMTDHGLFLGELQQVGVKKQRLSRHVISGWYNLESTTLPSGSSSNQKASTPQKTRRTCNLCNGTGVFEKVYASQYGVPGAVEHEYWCDICHGYDRAHHHKTCPSCGGKGTVE